MLSALAVVTALGARVSGRPGLRLLEKREEIESLWRADRRFEPQMEPGVRERLFGEWKSAVARCRSNA